MDQASIILIVDDDPIAHETLVALLTGYEYQLAHAYDGTEALNKAFAIQPDLILLDVMMPVMNGFEVCDSLRKHPSLAEVPIIMITALDDYESRLRGIEMGADDFISKPYNRAELRARVRTVTRLNRYRQLMLERERLAEYFKRSKDDLARSYEATLAGWVKALDLRDKETEGHSQRVTDMTVHLAQAYGIVGEELDHIRRGALLHDIGKLGIPDSILHKPGPLTEEEWIIMRKHTMYAYEWLSPIEYLHPAIDIPYCHHEKWDGTGYPRMLRGEEIPLAARMFAVIDVWDALRSVRPYRSAWSEERVRNHICLLTGTHFDPAVVDVFLSMIDGKANAHAA